jgi:hypothetical protein
MTGTITDVRTSAQVRVQLNRGPQKIFPNSKLKVDEGILNEATELSDPDGEKRDPKKKKKIGGDKKEKIEINPVVTERRRISSVMATLHAAKRLVENQRNSAKAARGITQYLTGKGYEDGIDFWFDKKSNMTPTELRVVNRGLGTQILNALVKWNPSVYANAELTGSGNKQKVIWEAKEVGVDTHKDETPGQGGPPEDAMDYSKYNVGNPVVSDSELNKILDAGRKL